MLYTTFRARSLVTNLTHVRCIYEKGPYEENIYEEHIFFVRPLLEHDGVREGALRIKYIRIYIFRKAPSRIWRVREGALRARMCALVTFMFSRVTN